jgi:hypothetical protein
MKKNQDIEDEKINDKIEDLERKGYKRDVL